MADNSESRKKALIISVLAFLFAGGGVFLFFIIQGADDLTGASKKGAFTYGGVAREATTSFFKFIGFDDAESALPKGGYKERPMPAWLKAEDERQRRALAESGGADILSDWKAPAASARSAIPRMSARGSAGLGGGGGGGSSSSGGVSRFGDSSDAGNVKISRGSAAGAGGVPVAGAMGALNNARAMLGAGLRSGSASTAKGQWDRSFGVGGSGPGGGNMSYGKSGLVNLDKIKKGEVDNLKTKADGSLKTPEVGEPVKDEAAEAQDPVLQKAKEAAEDTMKKDIAQALVGAVAPKLMSAGATDPAGDTASASRGVNPDSSGNCNPADGPQTQFCSAALDNRLMPDDNVLYKIVGNSSKGQIVDVTYNGSVPITDGVDAGKTINDTSPSTALVKPDGTVEFISWGDVKYETVPTVAK